MKQEFSKFTLNYAKTRVLSTDSAKSLILKGFLIFPFLPPVFLYKSIG